MTDQIPVGMGEIRVVRASAPEEAPVLVALGLGSCVGVCAYDARSRVAGMAHVVLPDSSGDAGPSPGKYADTAIPALLSEMRKAGALTYGIRIAIAGGSQLFATSGGSKLQVGARNVEAVLRALASARLAAHAKDVGGNAGRTVRLQARDGAVHVKTIWAGERMLTSLGACGISLSTVSVPGRNPQG